MSSSNRYTEAANSFFDSGADESDESAVEVVENETSDLYIALTTVDDWGRAFVKAHPTMTTKWSGMEDDELEPQVRYLKYLHDILQHIGKRQGKQNPVEIRFEKDDGYAAAFGDELPTIESEEVPKDVYELLKSREGGTEKWPKGATDALDNGVTPRAPVIDGEPLPLVVQTDEECNRALEHLAQIPDEPSLASTQGVNEESPCDNPIEAAAETLGVAPGVIDANLEGYPSPTELTVDGIRDTVTGINDEVVVKQMLHIEEAMKNRSTAVKALQGRLNRLSQSDDSPAGFFGGTSSDSSSAEEGGDEVVEVSLDADASKATRVEMAMSLMDDGMAMEEAKELCGL